MTDITRRTALVVSAAAAATPAVAQTQAAAATQWSLRSPGARTEIQARRNADGSLQYRVLLRRRGRSRAVLDWSTLGIVVQVQNTFEMRTPVISDFSTTEFVSLEHGNGEDAYTMVTGKRRENRARYNSLAINIRHTTTQRLLRLDLRAYDDGVAFRYVLPETHLSFHWMTQEKTEFNVGLGATHWGQAYDFYTMYHPSYETFYDALPSGTATPPTAGTAWGFPSLFETNGAFVLLHESGLDASFHGSHLETEAPNGIYRIAPPRQEEAQGFGANFPAAPLPWIMPWRMMIVSDDIADIVESNLVFHLAHPSRVADTSWIRPGVASWNWLSEHESTLDQAKLRVFIDLASEMGWPYTLIDANWNLSGKNAMEHLVAYANTKNVGLLFWYNSGGRHNIVTEQPRNILDDRARRRQEFARLQELGVRGVKVDFWQSDKQDIIKLYSDLMDDAAEFHLMTDFHGSTIPRGWERTWPNLISMEAVRGAEFYTFSGEQNYGPRAPHQNAIHPFLRNVIGPMDYTPTHFSQFAVPRVTTNAHEAALAVIFESGIQHLSDNAAAYRALPADWRTYLSGLATAWDETHLLSGEIGKDIVLARRNGARWWIAGINGEDRQKTARFDVAALANLSSAAPLVLFDEGANGFGSRRTLSRRGGAVTETMAPFGGFVMIFGA
ncbi:MAG: glycoside hydrolase family 97 catalytic domain-containing protein [Terricaulis sp.]